MAGLENIIDVFLDDAAGVRRRIVDVIRRAGDLSKLWTEFLSSDDTCMRRMNVIFTTHSCHMCERLSRLFELEPEVPFLIQSGALAGSHLIVHRRPGGTFCRYDPNLLIQAQHILKSAPLLGDCGFAQAQTYLVCDSLSAEILGRCVQEKYVFSAPTLVTGFRCHHTNYLIEQATVSWRDFQSELSTSDIPEALTQYCASLMQLSAFDFVSGGLDADSLRVTSEPPSVEIDGLHIYGRKTYAIGWTPGTSLAMDGVRICSPIVPDAAWGVHPKLKLIKLRLSDRTITMYQLGVYDRAQFLRHRRAGIPLYPGSLELYCLLLTLMSHPLFYEYVTTQHRALWMPLWLGQDGPNNVQDRLQEWHKVNYMPTFDDLIDVLTGELLRCDALSLTWSHLFNRS